MEECDTVDNFMVRVELVWPNKMWMEVASLKDEAKGQLTLEEIAWTS